MAVILLDTNVVSALMLQRPDPAVVRWLDGQLPQQIWLPSLVVFELRYGVLALPSGKRSQNLGEALERLLLELIQERIAHFDGRAAKQSAQLAAERRRRGRPVDLRDTLIAGTALAFGAQLATGNTRHFNDTAISLINPFTA